MFLQHTQIDYHSKHEAELAAEEAERQKVFDAVNAVLRVQVNCDVLTKDAKAHFCWEVCAASDECRKARNVLYKIQNTNENEEMLRLMHVREVARKRSENFLAELEVKKAKWQTEWENNLNGVVSEKTEGSLF